MTAGEREGGRVREAGTFPARCGYAVTLGTIFRETCFSVIGSSGCGKLLTVTTDALGHEIDILAACMAALAIEIRMHSNQWKARCFVHLAEFRFIRPLMRRMALAAIVRELPTMNIRMTL